MGRFKCLVRGPDSILDTVGLVPSRHCSAMGSGPEPPSAGPQSTRTLLQNPQLLPFLRGSLGKFQDPLQEREGGGPALRAGKD